MLGVPIELCFGSQQEQASLALHRGLGPLVSRRVSAPFPLHLYFLKSGHPSLTFSAHLLTAAPAGAHAYCPEAGVL